MKDFNIGVAISTSKQLAIIKRYTPDMWAEVEEWTIMTSKIYLKNREDNKC
jgi:hypothetical protein